MPAHSFKGVSMSTKELIRKLSLSALVTIGLFSRLSHADVSSLCHSLAQGNISSLDICLGGNSTEEQIKACNKYAPGVGGLFGLCLGWHDASAAKITACGSAAANSNMLLDCLSLPTDAAHIQICSQLAQGNDNIYGTCLVFQANTLDEIKSCSNQIANGDNAFGLCLANAHNF
jgi:hypothetical protein